jgi:hypothetical protein
MDAVYKKINKNKNKFTKRPGPHGGAPSCPQKTT